MELTKRDTQMAKGMAVLGMVMLHLFCRQSNLPYTPLIWCGELPLIYFLGLFGDLCVPVFCFCSGYAHYLMADAQKDAYPRRIPGKILRFLSNYWIVVVLFALVALLFGTSKQIPGSLGDFAANMLLVSNSYNGAWWFVTTYLILLVLSPVLAAMTRRHNGLLVMAGSFVLYFIAYIFRFKYALELPHPVLRWLWNQLVLLGTSQLAYLAGMTCRKYGVIGTLREYVRIRAVLRRSVVFLLPMAAFAGHCVVQSVFVAPFTAAAALVGLFLAKLPRWAEQAFLVLGKHSTNIWLVHMFFYAEPFRDLVFCAEYPLLILGLMLLLCFPTAMVLDFVYRPVSALLERRSS